MADKTHIEWTEATWNPITGCTVHSPGCKHCYAMKLAGTRLAHHPSRAGLTRDTKAGPVWTGEVRFNEQWLTQPLQWKRPRLIFVCAHGDLFHESVPDEWIDRVFAVMALCPQHTFQVLTKRSSRMRQYLTDPFTAARIARIMLDNREAWGVRWLPTVIDALANRAREEDPSIAAMPLPNVWLGVSVEDQARADQRIPALLATPAAIRWLSCEPLLGPVDLTSIDHERDRGWEEPLNALVAYTAEEAWADWEEEGHASPALDWIVAGGESGPGARPMHPDWARRLRDQCAAAGVPFFFKQWGEWVPLSGPDGFWPHNQPGALRLMPDGERHPRGHSMQRVGKKHAGRLLDSQLHDAFPQEGAD